MIPKDEVFAKLDKAYSDIVKAATQWKPGKDNAAVQHANPYPAKTMKLKGTYSDVNDLFAKRKWSLSLPIVPPTPERVAAMLKGTDRKPDEVLWVVPPRQGMLTVELVATLGVMAGSKPEHMNLLIAAAEAMTQPEAAWRGTSTTTASTYPVFVISGPVIEKLGLTPGTGTAGGENPVTNALGHFVNLVGDVVGGSVPPNLDKTTHGSSADLVATVFVENAKENPWGVSFAEQQGFKKTDSVITISTSYPPNGNIDHGSTTGKQILNTFAAGIAGTASGISSCYATYGSGDMTWYNNCTYVMMIVGPEHARTIQQDFKDIESVQDYLLKETKLPYKAYAYGTCRPPQDVVKTITEDTMLPRFTKPESFKIVVAGGAGKQSQFWVPFPQVTKPVSVKIQGY
jgi:hypothetical protein